MARAPGLSVGRAGRRVVLVTGAPGAGKSTLAIPLAAELGFALLRSEAVPAGAVPPAGAGGGAGVTEGTGGIGREPF
jgi:predicted ATPase